MFFTPSIARKSHDILKIGKGNEILRMLTGWPAPMNDTTF